MGFNLSSSMNLPIPQVGNEAGPQYAQDVNNCLTLVDQHNHSPGFGVQINPNGININTDLPMSANNLTLVRTVRFTPQSAALTAPADIGCLYEVTNDLYFNDGLGNNIRMTQGGAIAGTSGSISNLVPPASVAYVTLTKTVVFQSDTNTAANLDAGFIILRTSSVSSPGLTLSAPSSIASDYAINLPLLPLSTLPVQLDSSGNMSTGTIATAQIADAAVTNAKVAANAIGTSQIIDAAVTAAKIDPSVLAGVTVPAGVMSMYGGTAAPTGYVLCDGTSYLRATYPSLFTAIGTAFGTADGTHFNVPDMRGRFPRGVDGSAGRDPDASSRTAMNTGGNTGNNVGSVQTDQFKAHNHTQDFVFPPGDGIQAGSGTGFTVNAQTSTEGGNETRPLNAYVNFIIKT